MPPALPGDGYLRFALGLLEALSRESGTNVRLPVAPNGSKVSRNVGAIQLDRLRMPEIFRSADDNLLP